jgi:Schlafen group 3, DNA/RNA helicase domain
MSDMVKLLQEREEEFDLSRLLAGNSWQRKTKENKSVVDFVIDDIGFTWAKNYNTWAISNKNINEVGTVHHVQGFELNYVGVIFGNEYCLLGLLSTMPIVWHSCNRLYPSIAPATSTSPPAVSCLYRLAMIHLKTNEAQQIFGKNKCDTGEEKTERKVKNRRKSFTYIFKPLGLIRFQTGYDCRDAAVKSQLP